MSARTLLASAARTASSNGGALSLDFSRVRGALFVLTVTAAAADAADTLDVFVQHTWDGTNFDDFVHFTQVLGNGGAKTYLAQWRRDVSPESELRAPADATLAAGVLQGGPVGDDLRLKWLIVDSGDADQSFTFSVTALFEYDR